MTVVGIIGNELQIIDQVIDLFVKKYNFKSIKLINCNGNCFNKTQPTKFVSINLESNSSKENYDEIKKMICFCSVNSSGSLESMIKSRIKLVFSKITADWKSNYIISTISSEVEFEILSNTFFVSLAIDISILSKLSLELNSNEIVPEPIKEFSLRNAIKNNSAFLEKLMLILEYEKNEKKSDLVRLIKKSDFCINHFDDFVDLESKIDKLKLYKLNSRPNWDDYFMKIAWLTSQRSNCISRKVGSIIVRNKKIISTGYNGTPKNTKNCYEGGCSRCIDPNRIEGKSLENCACMHAEVNAMLLAGIERCIGATIYVTLMPCISCSKSIVQCEFARVVYATEYATPDNFSTIKFLENANIKVEKLFNNGIFNK